MLFRGRLNRCLDDERRVIFQSLEPVPDIGGGVIEESLFSEEVARVEAKGGEEFRNQFLPCILLGTEGRAIVLPFL
jgi:hypothetical protein